jgi:VWFA-related protein
MRQLFACLLLAVLIRPDSAAQSAQQPTEVFRGAVDLLTIDVSATDSRGRPVEDLQPDDFTVKVDGKSRQVTSAALISVDREKPVTQPGAPRPFVVSNESPEGSRRILIVVDQTLITPGALTPLLRTAAQFVDRLMPADYAAFIGLPEPGPRVDFTTDKALVHNAMQTISIGQPAKMQSNDFGMSLSEAFSITGPEAMQNKAPDTRPGPVMERVQQRSGGTRPQIYNAAMMMAAEARIEATISRRALESLLKDLALLEGHKTLLLFSAGLVNEDPTPLDDVARLAAAARTTINVIAVEPDRGERASETAPARSAGDRVLELAGLEGIADRTSGTLIRGIASGTGIFEQIERQLSAWYLVAVERQPGDAQRQRVEVSVKRGGVIVRSNRNLVSTKLATRDRPFEAILSDVLSSPFSIPGLPLRASTFIQRDRESERYWLRVAADVGLPGEAAGEFAVGYLLTTPGGRTVASAGARRTLTAGSGASNHLRSFDTAFAVAPGSYNLRLAVVDKAGRYGSVVSRVDVPAPAPGELTTSDLIVGNRPAAGGTLSPRVEPLVTTGELAAYLELYLPDVPADGLSVTLDIAEGEAAAPLVSRSLAIRAGNNRTYRVANGFLPVTVPAGRYVARAFVRRGDDVIKRLVRPVTIMRDQNTASR